MLNALRRGARSIWAKILIIVLAAMLSLWGISGFVNQIDPTEVARAGNTPVSAAEFARVYERAYSNTAQQMGTPLTPQQANSIGLPDQVLYTLIQDALLVDAAHDLGLDLSDEALAERIQGSEIFLDESGAFNRARFDALLSNNRYSEPEFIELQRQEAAQEMLMNGLIGGMTAPEPYLQALNRYANETRVVSWFTLGETAIGPIDDPTETELRAHYDANTASFRAPEYRSVAVVELSAEALAEPDAVAEEAVRAAYELPGAYGGTERRRVQQVLLDDRAVADRAVEAIEDGAAFEAILTELDRSFADVDLGLVTRNELVDPAVAEAAFAMAKPGVTAIDGRFGPVLVRVAEIAAAEKEPFEAVEPEIRRAIALDEAAEEARALFDSVEDAVAGGARVAEIAGRFGLPLTEVDAVDAEGQAPDGSDVALPGGPDALAVAFAAAEGDDAEPVRTDKGTVWIEVTGIRPSADRPFEEVKRDVLTGWIAAEKVSRQEAAGDEARTALSGGAEPSDVAQQYGATLATSDPFARAQPAANLPQAVASAAFDGPVGHVAVVEVDGSPAVVKVIEANQPVFFEGAAEIRPLAQTLNEGLAQTIRQNLVAAWDAEVGATLNRPIINEIIGIAERRQQPY